MDTDTSNQPLWQITGVSDTTRFDAMSGPTPVRRVYFRVHGGHESSVDIDHAKFDPDTVAQVVHEEAEKIHRTANLQGPPVNDYMNRY